MSCTANVKTLIFNAFHINLKKKCVIILGLVSVYPYITYRHTNNVLFHVKNYRKKIWTYLIINFYHWLCQLHQILIFIHIVKFIEDRWKHALYNFLHIYRRWIPKYTNKMMYGLFYIQMTHILRIFHFNYQNMR